MLDSDVAIVGLAARLPGADDAEELWLNLLRGRAIAAGPGEWAGSPDAGLLEILHAAIENAGYDATALSPGADLASGVARVSYRGQQGEQAITTRTGTSTVLAGLDQAWRSLRAGDSDLELVGVAAPGVGAAAVLVRRLGDALSQHDHVWAVIRGVAVGNAPAAGVAPAEVSYVEVDDCADLTAMAAVYGRCGVGSVGADLGPLAGLVEVIKVALALEREQLPAAAGPAAPLPAPLHPQDRVAPWPRDPHRPRLAAVRVAGAHVVLAEPPPQPYAAHREEPRVVLWSARTPAGEWAARGNLARYFVWRGEEVFADAVATLQHGRTAHPVRASAVVTGALDAAAALSAADAARVVTAGGPVRPLTLAFPGAGPVSAARDLHRDVPVFARALDGWLDLLDGPDLPVRERWLAAADDDDPAVLFAVQAALTQVWRAAGVRPVAVHGDGIGVLAAATAAEVFTPVDAAALVRTVSVAAGGDRAAVIERAFAGIAAKPPAVPLLRADTARPVTPEDVDDPTFWSRQLLAPPTAGPGVGRQVEVRPASTAALLTTAARLWTEGHDIGWEALGQRPLRRRVPIPGHPSGSPPTDGYALPLAAALARRRTGGRPTPVGLTLLVPPDAGPLVLAIPYAGASGRAFQGVRTYLPPGCGLALVDLPGHGVRMGEPCLRDVDDVVDELLRALPGLPTRRLLLLGYSLGGSFCYELAARMTATGTPPEGVVVCGSRSPQTGVGHPPVAHRPSGQPFLRAAVDMGLAAREMLEMPELAETFAAPLRADLEMVETFPHRTRRPRLPVPAAVIGLRGDWVVPEPSLRAWDELFRDPPLQLRVNGGHLALHEREREFGTAVRGALGHLLRLDRSGDPAHTPAP